MNTNVLSELRALHLPPPVSFWPPAIGWMVLFILIGLIFLSTVYFLKYHFKMWRIKREALRRLKMLYIAWQKKPINPEVMCQLSILLRRVALVVYPREKVAGLTGSAWVHFLNQCVNQPLFSNELSDLLLSVPYQSSPEIPNDNLFVAAKSWIKQVLKKY
jgi:hypothetical protein